MSNESPLYILKGDVRALSNARITARRVLSQIQQQSILFTVDLENQHGERPLYTGPLHLDLSVYFISSLPVYKQTKKTNCYNNNYNISKPLISTLIALIERIGQGVLFDEGISISSVNCVKRFTPQEEAYLAFKIEELKNH